MVGRLKKVLSERAYKIAEEIIKDLIEKYNSPEMRIAQPVQENRRLFVNDVLLQLGKHEIEMPNEVRSRVYGIAEDYIESYKKEDIDYWLSGIKTIMVRRVEILLKEAHDGNYPKDEAKNFVIRRIVIDIRGDLKSPYILRAKEGKEDLVDIVKTVVEDVLKKRRGMWEKKYKEILKRSDLSPEAKDKRLAVLRRYYFGKEDIEEIRKKRGEEEKRGEKLEEDLKEEERKILREDVREKRKGIFEADIPWEKKGFKDLSRTRKEIIREEWYKKKRKEYKKKHGLWDRVKRYGKGKEDVKEGRKGLRRDRAMAYGEVSENDYDDYAQKLEDREYRYDVLKNKPNKTVIDQNKMNGLKRDIKELKKKMKGKGWKRFGRGARRTATGPSKFARDTGKFVMKGFILACLVGIGVILSTMIGLSWHFILGFILWGLFYMLPDPNDFDVPDEVKNVSEDNPLKWTMIIPFLGGKKSTFIRNKNCGWGTFRSLVKVSVFAFFIIGIQSNPIPLGNIVLIIISFFGYYSLKISYDVDKPYELIESLLRFGLLGLYFIPWVIMYGIFDSMLLAFIAMAFFAIPPIPKDRKSSDLFATYDMYDKMLFGVVMIVVLILFLTGWDVPIGSTLGTTFLYFWFVTGIAGFFSPADARPAMGFIMLGGATIIYGIGPGTQEVMSGLFGPWWPTIQNTFESMTEPIGEAFGGLTNTMRSGWLLLTNPVGYATQLMNGTHAENPVGKTGALGIEIKDISISPIFPVQPFVITAMLSNEGAFDAENITIHLSTGYEPPKKKKPSKWLPGIQMFMPSAYMDNAMKFSEMFGMEVPVTCWENKTNPETTGKCENELIRQNIWQPIFTSDSGVSCDAIRDYELREKSIPIKVAVTYNYSADSQVDVEFISKEEWSRLAQANQLNQKLRIIHSQYSTAPVEFPIGTPGLKNPILVDQPFHLGVNIQPSGTKGSIESIQKIELEYPADFELETRGCTPKATVPESSSEGYKKLIWKFPTGGSKVIFCPFKALESNENSKRKVTGPTKTYVVKANADYTFTKWREKSTKIEFGGKCCSEDDCLKGQKCSDDGMCVPEGTAGTSADCGFDPDRNMGSMTFEKIPYHENLISAYVKEYGLTQYMDSESAAKALVAAIIYRESGWKELRKTPEPNNRYSFGLMQILFGTAKEMGFIPKTGYTAEDYLCKPSEPGNLCNPDRNIDYGIRYLVSRAEKVCEGKCSIENLMCAVSNYNAGSGCPLSTNENNCKYVKSVMKKYYEYYFYLDYCGWAEKKDLAKCVIGGGGCTSSSQCNQIVKYGEKKESLVCREDTNPRVCCPPSYETGSCGQQHSNWKGDLS